MTTAYLQRCTANILVVLQPCTPDPEDRRRNEEVQARAAEAEASPAVPGVHDSLQGEVHAGHRGPLR